MPVKLLADENIDQFIINGLRNTSYDVTSVFEKHRGISDAQVNALAIEQERLILTEDKDFGEWIFSHRKPSSGIILLRYSFTEGEAVLLSLLSVLHKYGSDLYGKLAVVTKNKLRVRNF